MIPPLSLKRVLTHPYLALIFRVYLGILFVYASMSKIIYTAEFVEVIANYQIAPYWAINMMAIVLPWIEMVAGMMLVAGIRSKSAAITIAFLLMMFSFAILLNLIKGATINCGCFPYSLNEPLSWWTFFRDLLWLGMALYVFFYDRLFQIERHLRFSRIAKEIQ